MRILFVLARVLQFLGLLLLPLAITGEMAGRLSLKQEYELAGAGIAVFLVGWLLQQGVKPR